MRHVNNSAGHQIAVELEKAKPQGEIGTIQIESLGTGPKQPRGETMH